MREQRVGSPTLTLSSWRERPELLSRLVPLNPGSRVLTATRRQSRPRTAGKMPAARFGSWKASNPKTRVQ
jgi:hypothetical protein